MKVPHQVLVEVGATVLLQVGPNKVLRLQNGETFPQGIFVNVSEFWTQLEQFNENISIE